MPAAPPPVFRSTRRRRGRTAVATGVAAAVALSGFGASAASAVVIEPEVTEIDIVSINDFHGRLEANGAAAGAAVLGGMVDFYEAQNPNTIFASSGDSVGASTFTSFIQNDEPTIDALNSIGLDVSAFGNHEFDQGQDDVNDRLIPRFGAGFVAANIYAAGTTTPVYDEYEIIEVDGVSVGFIGALTTNMPSLVSPDGITGLEFGPVVPAVNRVADELSDGDDANGEADVLVLLVHEGANSPELAASTDASAFGDIATNTSSDVDAIISGHSHFEYDFDIAGPDGTPRPVIQSGEYGEGFAHTSIQVDAATNELISISSTREPLASAARTTAGLTPFAPDPAVEAIVAAAVEVAAVEGSVPLGVITDDVNRAQQPGTGDREGTLVENRGGESTLGNLVADVQAWATQEAGAELALMNPGGLRTNLEAGDDGVVTYAEAAGVQPFANTLVAMDLTTEQLTAVLEEQWAHGTRTAFLKLGVSDALGYTYDPAAPYGSHITAIFKDGVEVLPGETHRVTVNSFLASGGDLFSTLAEGTNRVDTGQVDLQAFVDYFEAFETISPSTPQRSVGVTLPAGGLVEGTEATIELSSLLFSGGESFNSGVVQAAIGDTVLGSAELDPAAVPGTDEVGRASLTFTVPAGLSGDQLLSLTVASTGTQLAVPVTITAAAVVPPVVPPVDPPVAPAPGAGTGAGSGAGTGAGTAPIVVRVDADELAATGASTEGLVALMVLLLGAGGMLVGACRRMTRDGVTAE
ncbi:bifunctional metallophosphatase/5'-nucleotidase [Marisediminicola senii]|uniref:bifunctional metallophosphatase/5'-nucleotidase n=1 Tax=Marisediminicola senii TaxID=2711233 RepID=UPI0013EBB1CE|nr:bifunctional UDP-sugar hydrolase/5'-nucleotidase [Marisediminicola senii]